MVPTVVGYNSGVLRLFSLVFFFSISTSELHRGLSSAPHANFFLKFLISACEAKKPDRKWQEQR